MKEFLFTIFEEFSFLVATPFLIPEILWIVIPIVSLVFLITFYFTEYANERYGWDNAFINSATLFFVCIDSLRHMYNYTDPASFSNFTEHPYQVFFISLIMLEGIFMTYSTFTHRLPNFLRKFITNPLSVYIQMYVLAVIVYTKSVPNMHTVLATILLFTCLYVILWNFSSYIRAKIMKVEDIVS